MQLNLIPQTPEEVMIADSEYAYIQILEPTIKPAVREKSRSWTTINSQDIWFSGYVPNPILDSGCKESIVKYLVEHDRRIGA